MAFAPPEVCCYDEPTNQRLPYALMKGAGAQANLHILIDDFSIDFVCRSVICQSIELILWILGICAIKYAISRKIVHC